MPWRELPSQGHAKICQSRLTRWRSQGFLSCSYVFSSSWAPNELISTTNLVTTSMLRYMKVIVLVLYGAIELNWAKGRNEDLWYCKLFLPAKKHTFRYCPQVPQKVPFIADTWMPSNRHSVRYEGMNGRGEVANTQFFVAFFDHLHFTSSAFGIALDSSLRSIFPLLPT